MYHGSSLIHGSIYSCIRQCIQYYIRSLMHHIQYHLQYVQHSLILPSVLQTYVTYTSITVHILYLNLHVLTYYKQITLGLCSTFIYTSHAYVHPSQVTNIYFVRCCVSRNVRNGFLTTLFRCRLQFCYSTCQVHKSSSPFKPYSGSAWGNVKRNVQRMLTRVQGYIVYRSYFKGIVQWKLTSVENRLLRPIFIQRCGAEDFYRVFGNSVQ